MLPATKARFEPPPEATPLTAPPAWAFYALVAALAAVSATCIGFFGDAAFWPAPMPLVSIVALALLVALASPFGTFQTLEGLAEYASLAMPVGFAMLLVLDWREFVAAIALGEFFNFVSDRLRRKNPTMWYIRFFNVFAQIVAGASAELVIHFLRPLRIAASTGTWLAAGPALTLGLAAIAWRVVDSVQTSALITLAANRPLENARIPIRIFCSQLAMFLIAIPFARLWSDNAWVSLFALAPLGAAYRLLGLPELEYRATIDERTGLTNAGAFDRALHAAIGAAGWNAETLVLLAIDLDHFKTINDTFGHVIGDVVIARFAAILAQEARRDDVVARTGGEEFALLLRDAKRDAALSFAERLRRRIESEAFELAGVDAPISITASIGVAAYPEDGETPIDLCKAADAALYRAKRGGRNAVRSAQHGAAQAV